MASTIRQEQIDQRHGLDVKAVVLSRKSWRHMVGNLG